MTIIIHIALVKYPPQAKSQLTPIHILPTFVHLHGTSVCLCVCALLWGCTCLFVCALLWGCTCLFVCALLWGCTYLFVGGTCMCVPEVYVYISVCVCVCVCARLCVCVCACVLLVCF